MCKYVAVLFKNYQFIEQQKTLLYSKSMCIIKELMTISIIN